MAHDKGGRHGGGCEVGSRQRPHTIYRASADLRDQDAGRCHLARERLWQLHQRQCHCAGSGDVIALAATRAGQGEEED